MRAVALRALASSSFDRYARYRCLAELRASSLPEGPLRILDAGDPYGILGALFPADHTVSLDLFREGACTGPGHQHVLGSGAQLPFRDGSFDLAASHDVLEHLPAALVQPFVGELLRVSQGPVVVVAPFADPRTADCERIVNAYYRARTGRSLEPLDEHADGGGLPALETLTGWLDRQGIEWVAQPGGWLFHWLPMMLLKSHFVAAGDVVSDRCFDAAFNACLAERDRQAPYYRRALVIRPGGLEVGPPAVTDDPATIERDRHLLATFAWQVVAALGDGERPAEPGSPFRALLARQPPDASLLDAVESLRALLDCIDRDTAAIGPPPAHPAGTSPAPPAPPADAGAPPAITVVGAEPGSRLGSIAAVLGEVAAVHPVSGGGPGPDPGVPAGPGAGVVVVAAPALRAAPERFVAAGRLAVDLADEEPAPLPRADPLRRADVLLCASEALAERWAERLAGQGPAVVAVPSLPSPPPARVGTAGASGISPHTDDRVVVDCRGLDGLSGVAEVALALDPGRQLVLVDPGVRLHADLDVEQTDDPSCLWSARLAVRPFPPAAGAPPRSPEPTLQTVATVAPVVTSPQDPAAPVVAVHGAGLVARDPAEMLTFASLLLAHPVLWARFEAGAEGATAALAQLTAAGVRQLLGALGAAPQRQAVTRKLGPLTWWGWSKSIRRSRKPRAARVSRMASRSSQ